MSVYGKSFNAVVTPQSRPAPGKSMVENNAGGYVFPLDKWKMLDRFLILGNEGGSYYATEQKMTEDNAKSVMACLAEDGVRVVARIREISLGGRAPKNTPAQFALALCMTFGDEKTRQAAYATMPDVCRIPTHLFGLLGDLNALKPNVWCAGLRRSVSHWYNDKDLQKLAYLMVKYRQRQGWAHRDVLRLAHVKPDSMERSALFHWAVDGEVIRGGNEVRVQGLDLVYAFEEISRADSQDKVIQAIVEHNLPWEAIDTKWLGSPEVWEALLPNLPITATIRNLARMTQNGLLAPMSNAIKVVVDRITNEETIKYGRVHPIQFLSALMTYRSGRSGFTGRADTRRHMGHHDDVEVRTWNPVGQVVDALDAGFYLSFKAIEPTGKRFLLGLDVSGSMGAGEIAGVPGLTPRQGTAAMALATAKVEQNYHIMAFGDRFFELAITPRQRMDDVMNLIDDLPFERTDCALPMLYAEYNRIPVDVFAVYTDSETWYGKIHPFQALLQYRKAMGIDAKLVVVGMTSTGFSIADPSDAGMVDIIGMDSATPRLISEFALGNV